jgi:light-harvesting protein B-800-850 alpha chain
MNQGRIWCVVHPTVGLPLFLGSVALTSLAVHTAIMTHTTWMGTYWMGSKAKVAMQGNGPAVASAATNAGPAFSVTVTPVPGATPGTPASFVITMSPNAGAPVVVNAVTTKPAVDDSVAHPAVGAPVHTAAAD